VVVIEEGGASQTRQHAIHASDQLLVQYTASAITDTANGHVGLQAVTVSAVPEPGTAGLLFLGGLVLSRRRRL
jgi:hypothetical protein